VGKFYKIYCIFLSFLLTILFFFIILPKFFASMQTEAKMHLSASLKFEKYKKTRFLYRPAAKSENGNSKINMVF
jgi:hypothetical protein